MRRAWSREIFDEGARQAHAADVKPRGLPLIENRGSRIACGVLLYEKGGKKSKATPTGPKRSIISIVFATAAAR